MKIMSFTIYTCRNTKQWAKVGAMGKVKRNK